VADSDPGEVTVLLRAWHAGDEEAYRRVSSMLYDELRHRAASCLRGERRGDGLQTTALVHEVFMRLVPAGSVDWRDRRHFLTVAARTMRRVVVDLVRADRAVKRGSVAEHLPLDPNIALDGPELVDIVALDVALDKLAGLDMRKVRVIELRFFGGLTVEDTARVLDVSLDTITRDWRMARSWLLRELDTSRRTKGSASE
jgi:RNA polymerase sigma factor (TIGR02999 family)